MSIYVHVTTTIECRARLDSRGASTKDKTTRNHFTFMRGEYYITYNVYDSDRGSTTAVQTKLRRDKTTSGIEQRLHQIHITSIYIDASWCVEMRGWWKGARSLTSHHACVFVCALRDSLFWQWHIVDDKFKFLATGWLGRRQRRMGEPAHSPHTRTPHTPHAHHMCYVLPIGLPYLVRASQPVQRRARSSVYKRAPHLNDDSCGRFAYKCHNLMT